MIVAMPVIDRARQPTPELVHAVARLVPQLSPGRMGPAMTEMASLLEDERLHLLVARSDEGEIIGMVVLIFYEVPTGRRARIEDLVVLETYRGQGVGEALIRTAVETAKKERADILDLTSNPSRAEANGLYRKLGFQRWETNVYRLKVDDGG